MKAPRSHGCPPACPAREAGEHVWLTRSPEETRKLGGLLAACLQPGDLLCLRGDLGAGKTALVQGLAEGLEAAEPATSPGFTLIHRHQGRIPLYHLDLYRLGPADLPDIGVEEVLGGEAVVVVEWAERLPCGLSGDGLDIEMQFDAVDEQTRRFRLSPRGFRGKQILRALEERLHARACH